MRGLIVVKLCAELPGEGRVVVVVVEEVLMVSLMGLPMVVLCVLGTRGGQR
jgi:hypothetical protein